MYLVFSSVIIPYIGAHILLTSPANLSLETHLQKCISSIMPTKKACIAVSWVVSYNTFLDSHTQAGLEEGTRGKHAGFLSKT